MVCKMSINSENVYPSISRWNVLFVQSITQRYLIWYLTEESRTSPYFGGFLQHLFAVFRHIDQLTKHLYCLLDQWLTDIFFEELLYSCDMSSQFTASVWNSTSFSDSFNFFQSIDSPTIKKTTTQEWESVSACKWNDNLIKILLITYSD